MLRRQRATGDAGRVQSDGVFRFRLTAKRAADVQHRDVIGDVIVATVTWAGAEKSDRWSVRVVAGDELVDSCRVAPIGADFRHVV